MSKFVEILNDIHDIDNKIENIIYIKRKELNELEELRTNLDNVYKKIKQLKGEKTC